LINFIKAHNSMWDLLREDKRLVMTPQGAFKLVR
jgi:hypothetical protein